MADNAKKISELLVANTLSDEDRVLALVNPSGSANTRTITLENFTKSLTRPVTVVTNTSFTANSSHDILICRPTENSTIIFPAASANGKSYTVKYANGAGTITVQSNTAGRLENPSTGALGDTYVLTTGQAHSWAYNNGFYLYLGTPSAAVTDGLANSAAHIANTSNPHAVTAAQVGAMPVYTTRAAAIAANIPAIVTTLRLLGYYTAGDLGGAMYVRRGSQPAHALWFRSVDGAWWEINEPRVTSRMAGCRHVEDGSFNDTQAWRDLMGYAQITSTRVVYASPGGSYVTGRITIPRDCKLVAEPGGWMYGRWPAGKSISWIYAYPGAFPTSEGAIVNVESNAVLEGLLIAGITDVDCIRLQTWDGTAWVRSDMPSLYRIQTIGGRYGINSTALNARVFDVLSVAGGQVTSAIGNEACMFFGGSDLEAANLVGASGSYNGLSFVGIRHMVKGAIGEWCGTGGFNLFQCTACDFSDINVDRIGGPGVSLNNVASTRLQVRVRRSAISYSSANLRFDGPVNQSLIEYFGETTGIDDSGRYNAYFNIGTTPTNTFNISTLTDYTDAASLLVLENGVPLVASTDYTLSGATVTTTSNKSNCIIQILVRSFAAPTVAFAVTASGALFSSTTVRGRQDGGKGGIGGGLYLDNNTQTAIAPIRVT